MYTEDFISGFEACMMLIRERIMEDDADSTRRYLSAMAETVDAKRAEL